MIPRRVFIAQCLVMLVLALLGACALDQQPRHIIVTGAPADMSPELIDGADAWLQLGFDASFTSSGLPACVPRMAPEVVDCEVTLVVQRVANLERDYRADGLSSGNLIQIDATYTIGQAPDEPASSATWEGSVVGCTNGRKWSGFLADCFALWIAYGGGRRSSDQGCTDPGMGGPCHYLRQSK